MTKPKAKAIAQHPVGKIQPIAQPPIRKTSPTFKVRLFFRRMINSIKRRAPIHK